MHATVGGPMMTLRELGLFTLTLFALAGCPQKDQPSGLVAEAGTSAAPVDAGVAPIADISQCAGCQLAAQGGWTFEGIYSDATCTTPVAQQTVPSCAVVPAVGAVSITYVDTVGGRKAGETANVTLTEQLAPTATRYRKAGNVCVRANEGATDLAPAGCAGQRVCRDSTGMLACTGCRTFANGCPDHEETRLYAAINDPTAKAGGGGGGGGGNLGQCCAALAAEAKRLGNSPEAGVLAQAAAQCSALAGKGGTTNSPEVAVLKTMLAGRKVPPVCAGL